MDRRRGWRIGLLFALIWAVGLLIVWFATSKRDSETTPPTPTTSSATGAAPAPAEQSAAPAAAAKKTVAASPADENSSRKFGSLRGRVFDAVSGEPVREFKVEFHGHQRTKHGDEFPGARTFRADDGRFEWQYVVPGNWLLTVDARGYQRFAVSQLEVAKGEATREIPLPLRRGLTVRGRVYDEATGVGIAGASLSFRESGVGRFEGKWRIREHHQTAKDGSFVLDGLPRGRVTLSIHAQGYAAEERDVLVEGAPPVEIGLSAGGTIAGRLTAADGATPVAGMVSIMNLDAGFGGGNPTRDTGEFSFSHLSPGRYQVSGEVQGSAATPIEVVLGKNERVDGLVLSLASGRTIRGVVSGLPAELRRATRIQLQYEDVHMYLADVAVDERGAYTLQGIQPGRVRLVAGAPGRGPMSKAVTVPANADVTVDFEFPVGVRLYGRVTRGGSPVPEMVVQARLASANETSGTGETSQAGEYVIDGLVTGEYRVQAGAQRERVYLSGDTEFDFDLPDRHLAGHVFEAGGEVPLVAVSINVRNTATSGGTSVSHVETDHYGAFSILDLQPGEVALTLYKPGYEMLRQTVSFGESVSTMTLKLRPDPGVEIRAHDASTGRPLRGVFVAQSIKGGDGSQVEVHLDTEGVGRLPSALAGGRLRISAWGYATTEVSPWNGLPLDLQFTPSKE